MKPKLAHHPLFLALVLALFLTSCAWPESLTRAEEDHPDTITPYEAGPPSYRYDEEACVSRNACGGFCKSNRNCKKDEVCYESRCVSKNLEDAKKSPKTSSKSK